MTKKLPTAKFTTELDVDSFLSLHSDSDSDSASVPHRSLDEILNDSSDSSTSASPPSSPFTITNRHHLPPNDAVSADSSAESINDNNHTTQPRLNSFTRVKSGGFSGDPAWRLPSSSSSRPLPSLFGGVRSTTKPGAALAAAAAASRSVPTPHAAAIKSRRAVSLQKVTDSDDHEIVSNLSSNGDSIGVAAERTRSDDFQSALESEISAEYNRNLDNTSEAFSSINDSNVLEGEVEPQADLNNTSSVPNSNVNNELDLNDGSPILDTCDRLDDINVNANSKIDNSVSSGDDEGGDNELQPTVESLEDRNDQEEGEEDVLDPVIGGDSRDGDARSLSEISELVEEIIGQLESERLITNAEEKRKANMKPLELAEELEKKQASTGLHLEEGAAAQPMKFEGVRRGTTTLGYFDINADNAITRMIKSQAFRRDHGSPQVLAVHLNYIAVGMAKGVIAVVPSRYSSNTGDNMDSRMLLLGLQGDKSCSPVTSMCFNQQGDLLLAGYGDGHITVWDVQKASVAKVITGEHTSPVVHALFLGQDSQVTRQFKAVTSDCTGHLFLHSFQVYPILNRITIKTQCLLDGKNNGIALSASALLFGESFGGALPSSQGSASLSSSSIGNMMGGVVGGDAGWKLFNEGSSPAEEGVLILVTSQTALVVRFTPSLQIYAQLSKPDGVREGSMPYTAWKSTSQPHSSDSENINADAVERVSYLAVAWDRKVQVAKLVKSKLKVCGMWSLDSAAIGVAWLDAHMLVVLTLTGQLYLFAKDGTVIHQTSFAVDDSGGNDLAVYHTHFRNIYGNPEKAYHNCLAVRGASIYILGPMHFVVARLLLWKERIQVLRKAGDWMGALYMAMTLYDGEAHGVIDLPKSVDAVRATIMPYLAELLLAYVDEVFSYMSVAFCNQFGKVEREDESDTGNSSVHTEIKEQFTRVGGVAVEFCVHIHHTDILFDEIFSKFVAVQHRDTFLELLEPYILRDMLGSLPPEIMQALVEHYSSKGWLQRVEQCVLHMDISSLDFNQVVRLCREHGLYGALVYLFNKGLNDFKTPLEELLIASQNSYKESAAALGYKMLVYLKYCFSGLAFPPGQGYLPPTLLSSLRTDLVRCLLEKSSALNSAVDSTLPLKQTYLNLYHLLQLDTEATLDVLRLAFLDDQNPKLEFSPNDSPNGDVKDIAYETQNLLSQSTIDALVQIFENIGTQTAESANDTGSAEAWPSKKDIGYLFEFITCHVVLKKAYIPGSMLSQILEYFTSENNFPASILVHSAKTSKMREKEVLLLLEVVPVTDWDSLYVLQLCEKAQFHQVCGFIHMIGSQYVAALDSYMKDVDEPIHAFSYIDNTLRHVSSNELNAFQSAIILRIPELVVLSREGSFFLITEHFYNDNPQILSELQSHPKCLFLYLKTAIEVHLYGTLDFSDFQKNDDLDAFSGRRVEGQLKGLKAYIERISDFPKFIQNNPVSLTDDMIELYMELACQYERNSVLKFLETFDSYRVEHCLRLCQKYDITDGAAYLLERVGDVGSALLLTLTQLDDKFVNLDVAVESAISTTSVKGSIGMDYYNNVLKMKEVDDVHSILNACIGLCQRNTPRLQPEESETLWFRLLDSFCAPLMDSFSDERVLKGDNHIGMLNETFYGQEDEIIIKWNISKSHKNAAVLRKLFSQFIKEVVEGMIGYVRLPSIMSKLLSDKGNQEFGDFKSIILGMLGTYGFERRILDTAMSLIEDDTFYTMSLLKKGASHGYAPRNLVCCICNCLLTKNSPSFQLRVFNCGHATHLQCELLESESSSKGTLSGCPFCMPKKNTQKPRNKSVLAENSLVKKVSSKSRRAQGTGIFQPHEDSSEHSYGLQQLSRFEILRNLQKGQKLGQIENVPQLRLAPPAVYHERVKKGPEHYTGESSSAIAKVEKPNKRRQLRELKVGGTSLRFPLKSSIFGKEKINKR
ncbi:uncharacterized protein LOC126686054 [Mercurialis annua]|uniref:uncharacterized protein LOC126686054 n=1 Tax=Mercurialis annua TaxID=3986 RepID=UPI00215F5C77|nr:uncharacterized protein LOC126686054 [Mercurialis annua]